LLARSILPGHQFETHPGCERNRPVNIWGAVNQTKGPAQYRSPPRSLNEKTEDAEPTSGIPAMPCHAATPHLLDHSGGWSPGRHMFADTPACGYPLLFIGVFGWKIKSAFNGHLLPGTYLQARFLRRLDMASRSSAGLSDGSHADYLTKWASALQECRMQSWCTRPHYVLRRYRHPIFRATGEHIRAGHPRAAPRGRLAGHGHPEGFLPGSERNCPVNIWGSVNQRFREFWAEIWGCEGNPWGSFRGLPDL